ncbi:MAG: type II toxin-antitoxin system VapC family toxin [Candidatus Dormibacteraceae bacterium]
MKLCLDSWAVISWLEGHKPATTLVNAALDQHPIMIWINLGEVYYVLHRKANAERAEAIVRHLTTRLHLDQVTPERTLEAARIKAAFSMAYADAFAIATATAHSAVLLTGDPEILNSRGPWPVTDLR